MRIGIFDSGIGGMTVLSELVRQFPQADYTYLGDTANLPYGSKSPTQVRELSRICAESLAARGLDLLVVACNTASSLAIDVIREAAPGVPVVGMVEAGVRALAHARQAQSGGP